MTTTPLTDLEICRLCARAMGIPFTSRKVCHADITGGSVAENTASHTERWVDHYDYWPLTDKAQAWDLMETLDLEPRKGDGPEPHWTVMQNGVWGSGEHDADLRRAVCYCAAKVQLRRERK